MLAVPFGCWLCVLGAGDMDALFPGSWEPVEVGIVRRDTAGEGEWTEAELLVVLDWHPAGGRSVDDLPSAEQVRVLNTAFLIFSRTSESLLLADDEPLHLHTTRGWRGYRRLHMYFALPDVVPEKLELFIATAGYALAGFQATSSIADGNAEPFTAANVGWRLDRIEPGRIPPRMPEDLPDMGPDVHAMTAFTGPCPATDQALKLVFIGDRRMREGSSFWLDEARLKAGDREWTPAAADIGQSGDPAGRPHLVMWLPLAPEALPDRCELVMSGTAMLVDRRDVRETIYELPSPWVGP